MCTLKEWLNKCYIRTKSVWVLKWVPYSCMVEVSQINVTIFGQICPTSYTVEITQINAIFGQICPISYTVEITQINAIH